MKQIIILFLTLMFFLHCEFTGNMYSPDDPSYEPPSFTIDNDASNVADGDTVSADTIRFILTGNDEEYHRNRFRYQLDEGKWSDWEGDRKPVYEIELPDLPGGIHTFTIEVCYNPKEEKTDSTITFFRAVKPYIVDTAYTILAVNAQAVCTLTVKAEGSGDLDYTWYRNNTLLDSSTNDTLILKEVTPADTGLYYCLVTNSWGEISGPGIRLRLLFRVFYDGNGNTGGSVPVDTNGYEIGALAEPMNNTGNLTRRGYTFAGWNMKADGSGVSPDSGLKFEIGTDNVTLYAEWKENPSFSLAYSGNGSDGGKLPDTAKLYRTGEMLAVAGNSDNLAKSGYTFIGWNTTADGSGTSYGKGDSLQMGNGDINLYAQWSDNPTFSVTYSDNGADSGTAPTDSRRYEEGDTVTIAANSGNLVREGSTFTGWNTKAQGDDGTSYTPGATFVMPARKVILYARWTTNPTYTLTYLGNGNSAGSAPDSINIEKGAEITVAGQGTLVKKGYSFIGWNSAANGSGKTYAPNTTYAIATRNDTLYAQWEINRYRVIYDGNGSDVTGVPPSTTHRYGSGITLDTSLPVRTGYTFFRWNTKADGTGEDFQPGGAFTVGNADVTLYARWMINSYTLRYRGNGNTGGSPPDSVRADYGEPVNIAGRGNLVRTGYNFTEWNTKADGTGIPYPVETVIAMGAGEVELFAQWEKNRYKVTFMNNDEDATGKMEPQPIVFGQSANLTANGFSLTGHSFTGWATIAGSEVEYEDEAEYTMDTGDDTLYAVWTKKTYTVTFYKNDTFATGDMDSQPIAFGSSGKLMANGFTKTGWNFAGWATSDSGEVEYKDEEEYTMGAGDDTLYAVWTANTYAVTYEKDDATSGTVPDAQTKIHDISLTLATNTGNLAYTGYTFAGWNTKANGSGTSYDTGGSYTLNAAVTLYARWTANQYTVTFDKNDESATGSMASQTITFGESAALTAYGYTKTGWRFNGWTTSVGGEIEYEDEAEYTIGAGDDTLYAVWTINQYLVRFDTQGGSDVDSQYVTYNDTIVKPSDPTRTGYVFDGWYEDKDCTKKWNFGNMKITTVDTVYVKWLFICTVTFDGRSATTQPVPASKVTVEGETVGTLPTAPTKTGCTFAGWYTGIVGSGTEFTGSIPITGDITVYALWTMTDVEGNVYKTVTIGSQVWMGENLKTTKYRDGTNIPRVKESVEWENLSTPGYCWYDNDSAAYNEDYGILYNWYTVADTNSHQLAPAGWHVPSDAEWDTLSEYLGGSDVAGGKLKEAGTEHWSEPNTGATNETGFSALPGGFRYWGGDFGYQSEDGDWWSATEYDTSSAWSCSINHYVEYLNRNYYNEKSWGSSVRLLRN